MTQRLTFSIPDDDALYISSLATTFHNGNKSAALHDALRRVRELDASDAYAAAFDDWEKSGESSAWDATSADGIRE
jgi:hypothetical protein